MGQQSRSSQEIDGEPLKGCVISGKAPALSESSCSHLREQTMGVGVHWVTQSWRHPCAPHFLLISWEMSAGYPKSPCPKKASAGPQSQRPCPWQTSHDGEAKPGLPMIAVLHSLHHSSIVWFFLVRQVALQGDVSFPESSGHPFITAPAAQRQGRPRGSLVKPPPAGQGSGVRWGTHPPGGNPPFTNEGPREPWEEDRASSSDSCL